MQNMPPEIASENGSECLRSLRENILRAAKEKQNLFCPMCKRVGAHICVEEAGKRVGSLRGYGNAINAEAAKAFITAFMEAA